MSDKFNNLGNDTNNSNNSNNSNTVNNFNKNKKNTNYWKRQRGKKRKPNNQLVLYDDKTKQKNYSYYGPNNILNPYQNYQNYQDYWFYMNPNDLLKFDSKKNNQILIDEPNKISNYSQTDDNNINGDYYNEPFAFSEEFEKNILDELKKNTEPQLKQYKWIKLPKINNLIDLIEIGKQWGTTWTDDYEYNINIKLLNNIVPELEDLNLMIGLSGVKSQIIDLILYWTLGLDNKNHDLLHTVIEGEPGTGKTELAEKLAKIYLKLGILKSNVFKKVKRSDLVAGYLGQTAIKTAKVIEECKGGVLFIDEAYSLGNAEGKDGKDTFSKECIDTLNQSLTESKSDFICMIAGYADDLTKSFFSYNSGLERRFPIRFSIGTYTDIELGQIFIKKVREYEWDINLNSDELGQIIKENRTYFKFNGGDMEILFAKCKISHSKNLLKFELKEKKILDKQDIIDGIELYLLNPNIKKRKETHSMDKYIRDTLYI